VPLLALPGEARIQIFLEEVVVFLLELVDLVPDEVGDVGVAVSAN
jgi:hypothetical protein